MLKRRLFISFFILGSFLFVLQIIYLKSNVNAKTINPYSSPLLADYRQYYDAQMSGDYATISQIAFSNNGYLGLRAAMRLAQEPSISASERVNYYQRALDLRLQDPLDKLDKQAFLLDFARVAEEALLYSKAIELYGLALPDSFAEERLKALANPYELANLFLKSKQYQKAIDALNGLQAPSIEAPAYKRLKQDSLALDAYERWLAEVPNSYEALKGKAWSLYRLGYLSESMSAFKQLGGISGIYGQAFVEKKRGNLGAAVGLLEQTGDAEDLWLATTWLEDESRFSEAIEVYKLLVGGNSIYADDAAYRIYVLSNRFGDTTTADWASSFIPKDSFFAQRLNQKIPKPVDTQLTIEMPEVVARAHQLMQVYDTDAAKGELLYALKRGNKANDVLAIAEQLQQLGEYRQSSRAAQKLLNLGHKDIRVYRAAYPRAYAEDVVPESLRLGVEAELIWAIMRQESAFFPKALSRSNAQGLMQVIPSTWKWMAELQKEPPADPFDPATNIRYGSFYLYWLEKYFKDYSGDPELIVSSYNRGQGYIKRLFEGNRVNKDKDELYRRIDALETREYLQRVIVNYEMYKLLY